MKLNQTKCFQVRDEFVRQGVAAIELAKVKAHNAGVSGKRIAQASAAAMAALSAEAMALPPDFTTLTAAVDFSTAIAAVLLIFAAIAGFAIVWKGGKLILRALGFNF